MFSLVTGIYSYKSVPFLLKYIMKSWECETHTEAGSKEGVGGKAVFLKSLSVTTHYKFVWKEVV